MLDDPGFHDLDVEEPHKSQAGKFDRTTWGAWCLRKVCDVEKEEGFLNKQDLSERQRRCMVWSLMQYVGWTEYGDLLTERKQSAYRKLMERRKAAREARRAELRAEREEKKRLEKEAKVRQREKEKAEKEVEKKRKLEEEVEDEAEVVVEKYRKLEGGGVEVVEKKLKTVA